MDKKQRDTVFNILSELVRRNKTQLVRRQSNRFKVHRYVDGKGKRVYFLFDRKLNKVTRFIKEENAIFGVGEVVAVLGKFKAYPATIIQTVLPNEVPVRQAIPIRKPHRTKTFPLFSYVIEREGTHLWVSGQKLRKKGEVDDRSNQANAANFKDTRK